MNKKVLLGMSGGVDSSTSAYILKDMGYDVEGVTLELYPGSSCCNLSTYLDAKKVCSKLGIPHTIVDLKKEFQEYVVDDFFDKYRNCKTPNPCVECNKYLKFGIMWKKAVELGCDYVSTGHYAKVEYSEEYKRFVLKKSKNIKKDQTYFLYDIPKDVLEHVIFPLGDFEDKEDVRALAREKELPTYSRPDSEDLCFVPDGDYKKFLEEHGNFKKKKGNIVLKSTGEILGEHEGLYNYTVGQRKGMGIAYSEPLFVIGFDIAKNELLVGTKDELLTKEFLVENYNLLLVDEIKEPIKVNVKTRYTQKEYPATIEMTDNNKIKVTFDEPQINITPGQSAVFYIGDIVLGGGKIV